MDNRTSVTNDRKAVIIPTYNEKENIENIARAVFGLEGEYHIIIIDDGSPDGTADIVKKLQKEFPLITEQGLAKCLDDSRYMRFIDTRVSEYLERNTECADCEYAHTCAGGCRASALESEPGALFGPDPYACELFRGGWAPKIRAAAEAAIAKRKDQVQIKENER